MTPTTNPANRELLPLRAGRRLLAALASLRLAIVLLTLFTLCLAGATAIESAHSARAAQELVYRAWWFVLLLTLLAANVLGAALKKYPWHRHQTGFLVTHTGLLTLLAGGLLTALFGIEGQMVLVDTPSAEVQARVGVSDQGQAMYLDSLHQIDVFRLRRLRSATIDDATRLVRAIDGDLPVPEDLRSWVDGEWSFPINPGTFTWFTDDYGQRRLPWALDFLDRLAAPARGFQMALDRSTLFTVANFYPQVEDDPHRPLGFVPRAVRPGSEENRTPGLRCTLQADGKVQDFGVVQFRAAARVRVGEAIYLVRYRPAKCPLPFALTLKHAWQEKDPGSDRPAWFQSDVALASADRPGQAADGSLSMNRPLGHGHYKVFQANYRRLTNPMTGEAVQDGDRPVSLAGLAVAYDPGLWLKYLGSLVVVAGIATMFWMKAYFFKPRG